MESMEDSIVPSPQANTEKNELVSLERVRGLMSQERPRERRIKWLEKIVGKKKTFNM